MNVRERQGAIYTDGVLIIIDRIFIGDFRLFCLLPTDNPSVKKLYFDMIKFPFFLLFCIIKN